MLEGHSAISCGDNSFDVMPTQSHQTLSMLGDCDSALFGHHRDRGVGIAVGDFEYLAKNRLDAFAESGEAEVGLRHGTCVLRSGEPLRLCPTLRFSDHSRNRV